MTPNPNLIPAIPSGLGDLLSVPLALLCFVLLALLIAGLSRL